MRLCIRVFNHRDNFNDCIVSVRGLCWSTLHGLPRKQQCVLPTDGAVVLSLSRLFLVWCSGAHKLPKLARLRRPQRFKLRRLPCVEWSLLRCEPGMVCDLGRLQVVWLPAECNCLGLRGYQRSGNVMVRRQLQGSVQGDGESISQPLQVDG